jgi:VIT1/CCC1 family predicted Fe2+/Mn2+ transporter
MDDNHLGSRYRANLEDEQNSAYLYRILADVEPDERLSEVYGRLAETEEEHLRFWEQKIRDAGERVPERRVGWRTRVLGWLARRFGPQFVLPTIAAQEEADSGHYAAQFETSGTLMPSEERSHARLLRDMSTGSSPGPEGGAIARLEGRRHRAASGGNALRAAVLGANDGLLSNFSLVMGVVGAAFSSQTILITGLAGLLAGSGSMAMGEWISVRTSRELYERQVSIEEQEIIEVRAEEEEELALSYEAKGLREDQARTLAARLMADHKSALDTLSREELGIDPEELGGSARGRYSPPTFYSRSAPSCRCSRSCSSPGGRRSPPAFSRAQPGFSALGPRPRCSPARACSGPAPGRSWSGRRPQYSPTPSGPS